MTISVISPKQLQDRIQAGEPVHLIDVRTPAEFREVHVTVARNTPLESLNCSDVLAEHPTNAALYVICRSGSRGKQACEKFTAAGCTNVVNVEGGTMAWDQAGYPAHGAGSLCGKSLSQETVSTIGEQKNSTMPCSPCRSNSSGIWSPASSRKFRATLSMMRLRIVRNVRAWKAHGWVSERWNASIGCVKRQ